MESFDPFSQWLGRQSDRPPQDHYELLGLARFESDEDLISRTADTLRAKIRKIRPGVHLRHWQQLLDRLEAAKICLTDPIAKAAYDESIDTTPHTLHVSHGSLVTGTAWEPTPSPTPATGGPVPASARLERADPSAPATSQSAEPPPVIGDACHGAGDASFPSIRAARRKSAVPGLALWALLVAVLLVLVAVGLTALRQRYPARWVTADSSQPPASPTGSIASTESSQPAEPPTPTVSSLPAQEVPEPGSAAGSTRPPRTEKPVATPITPPPAAPVASPPGTSVDPARQRAFEQAIAAARSALAERDLEAAASRLNDAVSLAQTDAETAQARQVEALRAHVEAFWGSLQDLIGRLESGSEFHVADTMVVVVEAGPDFIIFRTAGQNRRYSIRGMPHALTAALAEQLFSNSTNAKVLRAAYLIAEPEGNAETARQFLQEASQGGTETSELLAELNRRR